MPAEVTMTPEMVANEILDKLFTNGAGEEADRLVLTKNNGKNLGGLCRASAYTEIYTSVIKLQED